MGLKKRRKVTRSIVRVRIVLIQQSSAKDCNTKRYRSRTIRGECVVKDTSTTQIDLPAERASLLLKGTSCCETAEVAWELLCLSAYLKQDPENALGTWRDRVGSCAVASDLFLTRYARFAARGAGQMSLACGFEDALLGWYQQWIMDQEAFIDTHIGAQLDALGWLGEGVFLERVFEVFSPIVYTISERCGLGFNLQPFERDDLYARVLESLLRVLLSGGYDESAASARGFIKVLAKRRAIDMLRSKQRGARVFGEQEVGDFDVLGHTHDPGVFGLATSEQHADLERLLPELLLAYTNALDLIEDQAPRRYMAWVMVMEQGKSRAETATILSMNPSTVRVNLRNVRQQLDAVLSTKAHQLDLDLDDCEYVAEILATFNANDTSEAASCS